ncbi:MAG: transketolase-like TK C-terminal-containing protein [Alistipes indistinctus]
MQAVKGAYIVMDCEGKPDVILLASGSEVATLVDGAEKLEADGAKVRVDSRFVGRPVPRTRAPRVSAERTARRVPKFGLTSGLPATLAGIGRLRLARCSVLTTSVIRPRRVLDGKFGFSGENVYNRVKAMLKK